MSASTEKKNRRAELEAGTSKKQTAQLKRDEQKAKERRSIGIMVGVVILILALAVFFLFKDTIIPNAKEASETRAYRSETAVTIGNRSYSPAEINYYYINAYQNAANSYDAAQYGLDTSAGPVGLGSQPYLGQSPEGKNIATWRDYLLDQVFTTLSELQGVLAYAEQNGIALTDEEIAEVDATMSSYQTYASMYGFTDVDKFLAANYGRGVDQKLVRQAELDNALANKAYSAYAESLSFTQAQLDDKYASYNGMYDSVSYAFYTVNAQADEEGSVSDLAKAEAYAEAEAVVTSYKDGGDVEDLYERFNGYIESELGDSATLDENYPLIYLSGDTGSWLMGDRQPGDVTVITEGDSATAVLFLERNSNRYHTVSVRHILIKAEAGEDGSWSDEALAAAKTEAERILNLWKSGEATEESFAKLAKEYSQDTGSASNGGLYENISKGQMVPEFEAFCFEDHQAGDTGIVYGSNGSYAGYHVMFFVGEGDLYCNLLAKQALQEEAISAWTESFHVEAVPGPGLDKVDPVTEPAAAEAPAETAEPAAASDK